MTSPANVLPRASLTEILARLDLELTQVGLQAKGGMILATDADGTIWDGDVGIDLFEALLTARGVRAEARAALAAESRLIGGNDDSDANALARGLYEAFKADRYAHDRAFAMMAWVFAGYQHDEIVTLCERVLTDGNISSRVRPEMRSMLEWAAGRGVDVYVVSASPRAVVEVAAARLGIAADRVVAMTPSVAADGTILPELAGPIVYGEGKLAALERARVGARATMLGAFGDSAYDAAMLRVARVPVAVTPTHSLVTLASTIPGLVVLDRNPSTRGV